MHRARQTTSLSQVRKEDLYLALRPTSAESEPCIRFSDVSMARSPRIVPGAASAGFVAPIIARTTCQVSSGPSTTSQQRRRRA